MAMNVPHDRICPECGSYMSWVKIITNANADTKDALSSVGKKLQQY